jgi:hypothetical protein
MFNIHQYTTNPALEILESGENSDCILVVEEEENDGQKKKVDSII